nr:hypothetical protein [Tanacetum cinerariifolium]
AMPSVISHWMVAKVMAEALDDKLGYPLMIISKDEYLTHLVPRGLSSGDIVDLIGDEDPTDKDGDTEVLVSLGEISSEGKKSWESDIGAKKEWGLSPKANVRVLHTAQLDVTRVTKCMWRRKLWNSICPHIFRLKRVKATWLKAEEEDWRVDEETRVV